MRGSSVWPGAGMAAAVAAAAVIFAVAAGVARAGSPAGVPLAERIAELQGELDGLRDESERLTGTRNLREARRRAEAELAGLRVRMDELEEAIERAEGSAADLAAYKKGLADKSVITGSDVAGEGAEKAGEAAARQGLSKGAGRVLGWLGIALDVAEYGGKWVLKQGDLEALDEAVEQSRVNLHDLYDVSIALSGRINATLKKIERMKEIIARDDELYPEFARLRERKRLLGEKATRRAVVTRETDAEGDAEERRKWSKEKARRGVSGVPPKVPVTPRPPTRQHY